MEIISNDCFPGSNKLVRSQPDLVEVLVDRGKKQISKRRWEAVKVVKLFKCAICHVLWVLCVSQSFMCQKTWLRDGFQLLFISSSGAHVFFFFFFGWKTRSALGRCKRPSKLSARRYFQTWFASLTLSCIACPQFRECQHPSSHNHGSVENGSLLY